MVLVTLSNTLALSHLRTLAPLHPCTLALPHSCTPALSHSLLQHCPNMVKNNKGGRRGWADKDQVAFMRCVEPAYLTCQELGKRSLADFWPGVFEEWIKRWPDTTADPEVKVANLKAQKLVRSSVTYIVLVAHLFSCPAHQAMVQQPLPHHRFESLFRICQSSQPERKKRTQTSARPSLFASLLSRTEDPVHYRRWMGRARIHAPRRCQQAGSGSEFPQQNLEGPVRTRDGRGEREG